MKKIHLACGSNIFDRGWINVDIRSDIAIPDNTIFLQHDLTKNLPFENNTIDYLYCSHFLEHLDPFDQAIDFLKECKRVIKKSGILRISVPDFRKIVNFYLTSPQDFYKEYNYTKPWFKKASSWERRIGISIMYGHKMLYDVTSLTEVLNLSGFSVANYFIDFSDNFFSNLNEIEKEIIYTHLSHSLIVDAAAKR